MMVHFMEKLNLDELYISGLVPLKVFCFQLDLLLRIHLPELYAYFVQYIYSYISIEFAWNRR